MLSFQRANELLSYNPETGEMFWKVNRNSRVRKGMKAGSLVKSGYLVLGIDRKVYQLHRVAWLLHTGQWPKGQIDHVNHIRIDNRFSNFREVSQKENQKNKSKFKNNTSGHTGVYPTRVGNWIVRIYSQGKHHNLGTFASIQDAIKARDDAKAKFNFHENHGN